MKERKIIQIGIVVKDLEKALKQYHEFFRVGSWDIYKYAPPEMKEGTYRGKPSDWSILIAFAWIGNMQIEIIQPLKGPSIYYEHLEKKGEGLHHIKENVDNSQEVIENFRQKGISVIQSGKFGESEFYYFDTEPILGISFEIGTSGGRKYREPDRRYPD